MNHSPAISGLDPRIWQAIIAGGFIALGWIVTNHLNRSASAQRRRERLRDVHRALYAEIGHNLANIGTVEDLDRQRAVMLDRITSGDGFVPFIPRERNDTIFRAIVSEIHILPRTSIDPIVAYFSQLAALDALIEDMRGETFKTLSPVRRAEVYSDYIDLKRQAKDYGDYALEMIEAYAKGGRIAAEQRDTALQQAAEKVNTPGADPSGQ